MLYATRNKNPEIQKLDNNRKQITEVLYFLKLVSVTSLKLKYIKFKNLDQIVITTNVYLYEHYQKTKTLCCHVSCFTPLTASG